MMKKRDNLRGAQSPENLEVFQLTEGDIPSSHFYCEAQVMTPDSRRLVLHTAAHPHGRLAGDPRHRYLVCDLEDHGRLTPVVDEPDATGPSLSPDGRTLYYFVDETHPGGGRFHIRRVGLDGSGRETLITVDAPVPGTRHQPSLLYPLSTLSSDGKHLAISCFLGDGRSEHAPWGLLVYDLATGLLTTPLSGPTFCNIHPQYCRSTDPAYARDILVQENHGCEVRPDGSVTVGCRPNGCEIHVIRDDGTNRRSFPWGLSPDEGCQGHQCWRGQTPWAITSTGDVGNMARRLIAGLPRAGSAGQGKGMARGTRVDLSDAMEKPDFWHFATDRSGRRLLTDGNYDRGGSLYVAELPADPYVAPSSFRLLFDVNTGPILKSEAHIHPFLSPDGLSAFFNSTESGTLHAYMARGF